MGKHHKIFYVLVLIPLAALIVGLWQFGWTKAHDRTLPSVQERQRDTERVEAVGLRLDRTGPPKLAPAVSARVPSSSSEQGWKSRAEREAAAKEERLLMAQTWSLSDEQLERFERAAKRDDHRARSAVYGQYDRKEIGPEDLDNKLEEADKQDNAQLREALGSHYQEYELMQGHFVEAGLLNRPFEPPVRAVPPASPSVPASAP
jgi:hypothetical protein